MFTKNINAKSILTALSNFFKNLRLTFGMIKDYWQGIYEDVSRKTIIYIIITVFYMIVSPLGYIPILGQIDDVIVIIICLKLIDKDLVKYKEFRNKQEES